MRSAGEIVYMVLKDLTGEAFASGKDARAWVEKHKADLATKKKALDDEQKQQEETGKAAVAAKPASRPAVGRRVGRRSRGMRTPAGDRGPGRFRAARWIPRCRRRLASGPRAPVCVARTARRTFGTSAAPDDLTLVVDGRDPAEHRRANAMTDRAWAGGAGRSSSSRSCSPTWADEMARPVEVDAAVQRITMRGRRRTPGRGGTVTPVAELVAVSAKQRADC
jgi:hypothetical protein